MGLSGPFKNFQNKYVEVITKRYIKSSVQHESYTEMMEEPIGFRGYLIDKDNQNYYLSDDATNINSIVQIDDVTYIKIVPQSNPNKEILDQYEPTKEEDIN